MTADATIIVFFIVFTPLLAGSVCLTWLLVKVRRRMNPDRATKVSIVERRWVLFPAAAFLATYALCILWAWLAEPYRVQVTVTQIPVSEPILGHGRFRIVQISDLHLEEKTRREMRILREIRDAKPHLILLTGDYLNRREAAPILVDLLAGLEAPYGVYAVAGNWDRKFIISDLFEEARRARGATHDWPRLLVDDYKLLKAGDRKLLIVGQACHPHRSLAELLEGSSENAYLVYLHHSPDAVERFTELPPDRRPDLFLCGHTHGGQVRVPFWGAVITLSKYHKRYEMGYYRVGPTHMYVNRGTGMEGGIAPRVRFLCRPEVAVIDLVSAPLPR